MKQWIFLLLMAVINLAALAIRAVVIARDPTLDLHDIALVFVHSAVTVLCTASLAVRRGEP